MVWVHSSILLPFRRSYCAVNIIIQRIEALDIALEQ